MEYKWEKSARAALLKGKGLPRKFRIVGFAVANDDTGEAALLRVAEHDGSVTCADLWKDISGDAWKHYDTSLESVFSDFPKRSGQC